MNIIIEIKLSNNISKFIKELKINADNIIIILPTKETISYMNNMHKCINKGIITERVSSWCYQETEYYLTELGENILQILKFKSK